MKGNAKLKCERMEAELKFLEECPTNRAFFLRLSERTIPMFRSFYLDQANLWKHQAVERGRIEEVNKELTNAFKVLWEETAPRDRWKIRRTLILLLRKIRGPSFDCHGPGFSFDFGLGLINSVYVALQELYLHHISLPREYPFAPAALKIINFEESRRYNNALRCVHCDRLLGMTCEECLSKGHPFYQLMRRRAPFNWSPGSERRKLSFSGKILREKHQRIYAFSLGSFEINRSHEQKIINKFRSFDFDYILFKMRNEFAPITRAVRDFRMKGIHENAECYSDCMWMALEDIEATVQARDGVLWPPGIPRLKGKLYEIGILAYEVRTKYSLVWKRNEFSRLDRPNAPIQYLNRKAALRWLKMLCHEVHTSEIVRTEQKNIKTSSMERLKVPERDSDEGMFCEWYVEYKKDRAHKPSCEKTKAKTISAFKKSGVKLSRTYKDSTYKTWIKNFNKRAKHLKPK